VTYGPLLDAIRGIRWPSRRRATGVLPGSHASRRRGAAPELSEYRAYRQGDDPRLLDWKLLARTDRAFVRLAEERAILSTLLLLDASASMAFPEGDASKWAYGCSLAVALSSIAHGSGDPVGVIVPTLRGEVSLAPRSRRGVVSEIVRALGSVVPTGSPAMAPALERIRGGVRVVIVSDFLGDADATRRAAQALVASGSDVHAVHVVASEELELPRQSALYTDPEDASLVRPFDPEAQRAYAERFSAWRDESARGWRLAGATYTEVVTRDDAARSVRRIARDAATARA
jgi:uncharacterized protein (DUF58 family)